jgi:hypothetical protein
MSLNPAILDVALAKTTDESERKFIRRLKKDYMQLLKEQDASLLKIRANMVRRGEKLPQYSPEFQAEIDEMTESVTTLDEDTLNDCRKMSAKEIVGTLGYALKFNVPASRQLLTYLHREDRPIQKAWIDLQERVADEMLEFALDEADRGQIINEIGEFYRDSEKPGVALFIVLEREVTDFDTFVNGKAVGAALEKLESLSRSLGSRDLGYFLEMDQGKGGEWFAPEDCIQVVTALEAALQKSPRKVKQSKAVLADLREYLDVFTYARDHGIRFRFHLDI